ncbi:hypothetical protein H4S07_001513 [Coemansia furcata]|uniref:Uncharacterized protein n=1 Tax=Coemansia furcata TaxID=417177 RepID=A0ACC1LNG8_9FUNG|nr:hypothetical protein H4S07_001513 [Coemansia furcata]
MSGKGKQPRVKGNLKPTSSSRAADLLGGDMSAINAFKANPALAFSQLSRPTPLSSPKSTPERTPTPSADIEQIDGRLAAQIKRLGKNDSTTKIRALFELKSYASEHTWETGLEGMMLAWPPLFKRHIFDPDRRVRVAVAGVHSVLVKRCGKRLAPNLKPLIGAWVASFYDPHREVGKASRLAFELVFPESKRTEAYAYCLKDILEFAQDNIVNQTKESLSDPRFSDAEEMRAKYEHIVGASFGALALVIEEVPMERLVEEQAAFDELLGNKEAMAFVGGGGGGGESTAFIRRSVYRLIRTIMLKCPELVRDTYRVMGQALLSNCFAEADPNAHGDMWDAVLLLTKNYPQAWAPEEEGSGGKKAKSVANRLFEFLGSGKCRLAPTISYPSILALLANLPSAIVDDMSFQTAFSDALWKGASATGAEPGSRAYHQENVGFVSAICECFSFLWTRTLKSPTDHSLAVGKAAAKEVDRLWHFYLQHAESFEEMAVPIVKLYGKIDMLSMKYAPELLEKVWTHASWFALQRVIGDGTHAIVYLISQIMQITGAAMVADSARKLVVGFCLLAVQSEDKAVAQRLIQTLSQLAPDVVFQEGFSAKFSARLEGIGSQQEAIDLVVSRAQYQAATSVASAAQGIDAFIESSLQPAAGEAGLRVVGGVLAAVAESDLAKANAEWRREARMPLLEQALVSGVPSLPSGADDVLSSSVGAPSAALIRVYGQVLVAYFRGTEYIGTQAANKLFSWTCQVFQLYYEMQWSRNVTQSVNLEAWTGATYEVLSVWITLSRDEMAGPRFIRHWLEQPAGSLGLLFDFATVSSGEGSEEEEGSMRGKVYPQARRCWAAAEAQVGKLGMGMQLAQALSTAISGDVCDLRAAKDPRHLARLAHAVYSRLCSAEQRAQLAHAWAVDPRPWLLAIDGDAQAAGASAEVYLAALSAAGSSGLRQAVDDHAGVSRSFHTLTHWTVTATKKVAGPAFDVFGLSRLARHAMFAAEFVRLSSVDLLCNEAEEVAGFILNMTLAFVLLRESLHNAAASDNDDDQKNLGVVRVDGDSRLYGRVSGAAQCIQDIVSTLLGCVMPDRRDPSRWLAVLAQHAVGQSDSSEDVWARVVSLCVARSSEGVWALVLGTLAEWAQWTQPLDSADVESALADPLARHIEKPIEALPAALLVVVARAASLRRRCGGAPAMRSALLDWVKHVGNEMERCSGSPAGLLRLVGGLELLAELVPENAGLDAVTVAKVVRILLAVPDILASSAADARAALPLVLAALAVLQRLAEGKPLLDDECATALGRLCLRWIANAECDAVLAAASRAVGALALATRGSAGPVLRQLGDQLLDACVLSDRPLHDGVRALSVLARCSHVAVPAFDRLYPVLANAMPRLAVELIRLILSGDDLAEYMAGHLDSLVRLIATAAKSLRDLGVPLEEFAEAMEGDEYIRCAGLRLLLSLLLAALCANAMDGERLDELAEKVRPVFDDALPWVCALLGLGNNPAAGGGFNARMWDISEGLDWPSWVDELARNPGGEQVCRVLAYHLLCRLAWAFPATLRSWWTGLSQAFRGTSIAVEAFMARNVCPLVIENEIKRIRQQLNNDEPLVESLELCDLDMPERKPTAIAKVLEEYDEATVRPSATQVTLTYTVDDNTLEVVVKIPPAYPLALPVFESLRRVAVNEKRWRCWLVAAQTQMARNCRVDEACAHVLGNIGAHFAGVEDCAICYSAVGVLDNTLPGKQCKICKNKFHRMCLFKWFSTSNQSACPLCRNLF